MLYSGGLEREFDDFCIYVDYVTALELDLDAPTPWVDFNATIPDPRNPKSRYKCRFVHHHHRVAPSPYTHIRSIRKRHRRLWRSPYQVVCRYPTHPAPPPLLVEFLASASNDADVFSATRTFTLHAIPIGHRTTTSAHQPAPFTFTNEYMPSEVQHFDTEPPPPAHVV